MFISWILNSRIEPIAANKSILILEAYHNPQIGYILGAMELALHRDDQQIIFSKHLVEIRNHREKAFAISSHKREKKS